MADGPRFRLHLNVAKIEVFWPIKDPQSRLPGVFPPSIARPLRGVTVLGGSSADLQAKFLRPSGIVDAGPSFDDALQVFSDNTGLVLLALSKTNIYFAGVRTDVKSLIIGDTGYVEDTFPFKYLGIPLHSSRLTRDLLQPLLAKITSKLGHWTSLQLSYAGKVNLLNSVIFGIEAYWCASLLLPKEVVKALETECRKFLWGSAANRRMYFFSWNKVCRSRQQGGMDIREVLSWNKALLLQMFWKLCYKNISIWMQCSTLYIFKLKSCWDLDAASCVSPLWAQILRIGDEFVQKIGSPGAARHCFHTWMVMNKFPLHEAYKCFHGVHPEPKWMRPILDSIVIPKHAFTATLAVQQGLATVDNICKRGMAIVNRCTLCYRAADENTQHLFFVYPFSNGILQEVLVWQGVTRRVLSLKHELYKLALCGGKLWKKKIACCALAATIHHIWQERNARIFKGVRHTPAQILARIKYEVYVRFYAWNRGVDTDQLLSLLIG
ncbi:uncharacterized protein LOC141613955 [Silene latifolia]|uniref:uncharacterized protein LOC141613955 n=1 Tax=Silene latifolia TaxID=37657 RepID=UPI003D7748ED